jgi:drug/metabolite transporter superfamily protein YnfA
MSWLLQLALLSLAAVFEVGGDALIRRGLDSRGLVLIFVGFVVLGTYGVLVNLVGLDFSRLLGAYVGWFAVISVAFGRFVFGDAIAPSTWFGLLLIAAGSGVIQFGPRP